MSNDSMKNSQVSAGVKSEGLSLPPYSESWDGLAPFDPEKNPIGGITPGSVYDAEEYVRLKGAAVVKDLEVFRRKKAAEKAESEKREKASKPMPHTVSIASAFTAAEGIWAGSEKPGERRNVGSEGAERAESGEKGTNVSPGAPGVALLRNEEPSLFVSHTANEWMQIASGEPDPSQLWFDFWNEGELCCLFADSNCGKSILAVQIASEVARRMKVLYFDFEMSRKQFQRRYCDDEGKMYRFADNFVRIEMNPQGFKSAGNIEEMIVDEIRHEIIKQGAKVVIVDNLGFICTQSEQGDAAGRLMRRLKDIQAAAGVSMLVIGHTPKRDLTQPITANELAGSKRLFNFFDSVFCIGASSRDEELRYMKQLKVRAGEFTYTSENVLVCELTRRDGLLCFKGVARDREERHLRRVEDEERAALEARILELGKQGKTQREIAAEVKVSLGKVNRIMKKYRGQAA